MSQNNKIMDGDFNEKLSKFLNGLENERNFYYKKCKAIEKLIKNAVIVNQKDIEDKRNECIYNMEDTVPKCKKQFSCQNFRHASAYHHQWLNGRDRGGRDGGKEGEEKEERKERRAEKPKQIIGSMKPKTGWPPAPPPRPHIFTFIA